MIMCLKVGCVFNEQRLEVTDLMVCYVLLDVSFLLPRSLRFTYKLHRLQYP